MTAVHWLLVAIFAPLVAFACLPTTGMLWELRQATRRHPAPEAGEWLPRTPRWDETTPLPSALDIEAEFARIRHDLRRYGFERPA